MCIKKIFSFGLVVLFTAIVLGFTISSVKAEEGFAKWRKSLDKQEQVLNLKEKQLKLNEREMKLDLREKKMKLKQKKEMKKLKDYGKKGYGFDKEKREKGFWKDRKEHRGHRHIIFKCLFLIGMLIVHILLTVWVYTDIRTRNSGSGLWIVITLIAGFLGAITYSLVRLGDIKKQ